MKNVIGNTCVSAFIMSNELHQEFINPFIWCVIDAHSMYNLIKNYDDINFLNYELVKDEHWHFSIIIDGIVKIQYPHYMFDATCKELKIVGNDIFNDHIWKYITNEYDKRVKRMLEKKLPPIFIVGSLHPLHWYNEEEIRRICSIETKYPIIISNAGMNFSKDYPDIMFNVSAYKDDGHANNAIVGTEVFNKFKPIFIE